MTDYTLPDDLVPFDVDFYLQPHTGGSESPFSRQTKVYELSAPRWVCRMSFRGGYNGTTAQNAFGPRVDAMIAKLKGRQNRLALYDWRRPDFRGGVPTGNNLAAAGVTSMTLTGLTPGALIYNGDYIGGDGRPHIIADGTFGAVHATAAGDGTATVTFEPPLQSEIEANAAVFGNPTGLFRLVSDDAGASPVEVGSAQVHSLEFVEDPPAPETTEALLFKRIVLPWSGTAGLNAYRFGSIAELTETTGVLAYSARDDTTNNGELGFQLMSVTYTINEGAETITLGTPQVVETTAFFAAGGGAVWAGQLLKLPTGRILYFYNHVNSPDGDYANVAARSDICLRYSDDSGATWSARQVISAGETANTSFGLADWNSAGAGLNIVGGVNTVVQQPSGRIVFTGYLGASGAVYLGSLYTDSAGGITGWTYGSPTAMDYPDENEPSVALASDGSLIAFVRREDDSGRAIYTSPTGVTWTFDRIEGDLPLSNTAAAAYFDGSRQIVGAPDHATNNRLKYTLSLSTDDAANFADTTNQPFHAAQNVGYTLLTKLSSGRYVLVYETNGIQDVGSFNQTSTANPAAGPSLGMAVFNRAYLTGTALATAPLDSTVYVAATEAAAYAAAVTGDGGTVQDSAAVLAAITAAINGNYYSKIGFAVSARWGHKNLGAASYKLYSIGPASIFPTAASRYNDQSSVSEAVALDTTTFAYAVAKFNGATGQAWIQFDATVLRHGSRFGAVLAEKTSGLNNTNGITLSWTDGGGNSFAPGESGLANTVFLKHAPGAATDNTKVAGYVYDFDETLAIAFQDGIATHSNSYFTHSVGLAETASIRIQGGASNALLAEAWFFNGADLTIEAVQQAGVDVGGRY